MADEENDENIVGDWEQKDESLLTDETEETFTYKVTLGVGTAYVGSDYVSTEPLRDFGYSDQEWDGLSESEQESCIDEWVSDHVSNNIDSWGKVEK